MLDFGGVEDDGVVVAGEVALAHFIDIFIMAVGYPAAGVAGRGRGLSGGQALRGAELMILITY